MAQLNSRTIKEILQETLRTYGDSLKRVVKIIIQDQQVDILSYERDNTEKLPSPTSSIEQAASYSLLANLPLKPNCNQSDYEEAISSL